MAKRDSWKGSTRWSLVVPIQIRETGDSWKGSTRWSLVVPIQIREAGDDERMKLGVLSADWAIGTSGWRKALAREYAQTKLAPEWAADELEEFRQYLWQQELEVGLPQIGHTLDDAAAAPKTISWKLELAYRLRRAAAAPYSWISKTLRMGAASSVRAALSRRLQQPAG